MEKETVMIVIIAVACVVVLTIILVFIGVACIMYRRKKGQPEKPSAMTNVDEVDEVVRTETGKYEHSITTNPAFGKDELLQGQDLSQFDAVQGEFDTIDDKFDGKPVNFKMELGDMFDEEGKEASETGSNYSFSPDNNDDDTLEENTDNKISILNDSTWGGVSNNPNDPGFDFNMFNPLRGVQSHSENNVHRSSMNQHAVDIYEAGQALKLEVPPSNTNPVNYTNTGSRLLWQKKRFKNF